jgi:hypothetical protein
MQMNFIGRRRAADKELTPTLGTPTKRAVPQLMVAREAFAWAAHEDVAGIASLWGDVLRS